ncbi:macro domain-containing protein [Lysobacter hankyongensis]|uniref:Macro domain-containing protein n=1 Tax=Lysobacter hankyongensis TaxID=1176535 RepID=A0ABP9BKP0_9GAMM
MRASVVDGDLLDQPVEAIVNAWNRNIIPWWLLLPQGVSGAIKRRGGYRPFIEVGRAGPIPLGEAVATSAGRLPFKTILHVAGIDLLWRASPYSIRTSVRSAMTLAQRQGIASIAFPVIGAGSGGFDEDEALRLMHETLAGIDAAIDVRIVRYRPQASR